MKVMHLFSEEKFIDRHIDFVYQEPGLSNRFIYLRDKYSYSGKYTQDLEFVVPYSQSFNLLIGQCDEFDVLMVYYLSEDKAMFVNLVNSDRTTIIWNFYGGDLYGLLENSISLWSKRTQRLIGITRVKRLISLIRAKSRCKKAFEQEKAIKKIDYFTWYSKEEYKYLCGAYKKKLPPFLEIPVLTPFDTIIGENGNRQGLLLGNSLDPSNNHVDVLDKLYEVQFSEKITLPVSYPNNPIYLESLKSMAKDLQTSFIENFISYDEYIQIINAHKALIINSYRQMALGNIFIALKCGLKVYLSVRNPSYLWLKRVGFIIFSVEHHLENDVVANNLSLNDEDVRINIECCYQLGNENKRKSYKDALKRFSKKMNNDD